MIQLKTIGTGNQAFAVLLEPETSAKNNTQLQAAVDANRRAVIAKYKGVSWDLEPEPQILTPDEFRQTWQGD